MTLGLCLTLISYNHCGGSLSSPLFLCLEKRKKPPSPSLLAPLQTSGRVALEGDENIRVLQHP